MGGINSLSGPNNVSVNDFLERDCPSFYKRDYFQMMFKRPNPA